MSKFGKNKMNIAIIPARGGSKRIPKKNIKAFFGKPMIAYAIEAAQKSKLFNHIIVSTDCPSIKSVSESLGASVPFVRPDNLSDDFTGTGAVVNHALEWFQDHHGKADYACCIYPTAPFLLADDLNKAFDLLNTQPEKDFVFSVARYAFPVQRALTFNATHDIEMLFPEHAGTRSQDLEDVFHDAGQFYFGKTDAFLKSLPTFSHHSIPYFMPRSRVMDIDDEEDWQQAEQMYQAYLLINQQAQ